ncbi:MAG: thymidine phosphorylase [Paracoccus sp. (in: a-proteobacteria)]|nr:thymidine phosphorylase [Paracoccus sp. (in: a-proteobacteria)]
MSEARRIIADLREGRGLAPADAVWIARGLADGAVDDAQAGAFAMAVLLCGLDGAGRVALTEAMRDSGAVLSWDLPGPVVDKHSTGGVGDSVSLLLAPALAACGAYVPMISGRGLGHTGGTLDKMEAIPGYRTDIDRDTLERVLREAGCAIIGATADIAPADRRLYAIRDVTATVESIDLITASILSKKLAAGLGALVLDVKCGSGAFMSTEAEARALAEALVETANGAGCRTAALVTDMNSPLGRTAGNAVEVAEIIALLTDPQDCPLLDVTISLGAKALLLAELEGNPAAAANKIRAAITSGRAAEHFTRMVRALGGPPDLLERPDRHLRIAPAAPLPKLRHRFVRAIDTRRLGELVVRMGGGRLRSGDRVNHAVGLSHLPRVGDDLNAAPTPLIHAADPAETEHFAREWAACYETTPGPVPAKRLIIGEIPGS